ncbi:MAG: GntR family transcriptional regulator [Bacteroidota bacterium]
MIKKINFRDQVKEVLLKRMRSGNLDPKKSLSLASLARELDVSVTPIREALTQLQTSGIVESIPNRGFFIPKLSKGEAKNLYELVSSIESLAVMHSTFEEQDIAKLKELNETFKHTDTIIQRINGDMDFHDTLTSNYDNPIALKILSDLKTRIFFYELDFMSTESFYLDSSSDHEQIIAQIEAGDLERACVVLKKNWLNILDHLNL